MLIEGQTALVTGGGSGLGAATARHFAGLGARVAILDSDGERAAAVAAEIGGIACAADVADGRRIEAAFEEVAGQLGAPRIAVNCAGVGLAARIVGREGRLSLDVFEKTLRVNLFGTYHVMSLAARGMAALDPLDGERGVIVNTASIALEDGQFGQAAYAASKGAVAAMCLPAAREFAQSAIRIAAIAPGLFDTPMMEGLPAEVTRKIAADVPFPARLGAPDEFARLAAHIVTNRYINGTTIRLDGAVRLPPR